MLTDEILVSSEIIPCNPDCVLVLAVSHDLRDAVLRRNGDLHVHMVQHDMSPGNPAFLLGGEFPEPFTGHFPQFVQYLLLPLFGDEHHVVFAFPACVTDYLLLRTWSFSIVPALASRNQCSGHFCNCQTLRVSSAKPGVYLFIINLLI